MRGKQAVLGDGVIMIYRLVVISLIAVMVFGLSSVFYSHYIDVRDVEAVLMGQAVTDCLLPDGVVDIASVEGKVLFYCGYDEVEVERFYVKVRVEDDSGNEVRVWEQGDSGKSWIRDFFDRRVSPGTLEIEKYEPGYINRDFPIHYKKEHDGRIVSGKIFVEVLVSDEF